VSLPKTRQSYNDCYDLFDRALEAEQGIRISVETYEGAQSLRSRLHMARQLNRDDNRSTYDEGHAMHGASPYDKLKVRIREAKGRTYLYIEPIDKGLGEIEDLSQVDEEDSAPTKSGDIAVLGAIVEAAKRRG
jgi:hypothetical protein